MPHGHWHTTTLRTCHGGSRTHPTLPRLGLHHTTRLTALSPRAVRYLRVRAAHGGVIPTAVAHTNPSPLPTGVGGSSGSGTFWAQIVVLARALRPTVHPLRGLRLHHFGLKPDRSLGDASRHGDPIRISMGASQVACRLECAHLRRGLPVHPCRLKLRCPHPGA